jgi:hypothetical protein
MVTIEYLEDENGEQQVVSEIAAIAIKGREDAGFANLSKYIAEALEFLKEVGVPKDSALLPFETLNEEGHKLTFASILKHIKHHPPLLEFRVNRREAGFFRAIFFCIEDSKGNQTLYFTKALLKQEKNPPEFTALAIESEKMLRAFSAKNSE